MSAGPVELAAEGKGRTQGAFDGPVFMVRADSGLASSAWIRCPTVARYRYESFSPIKGAVELNSPDDARALFPLALKNLDSRLMRGERILVDYVLSGRFVLDKVPNSATAHSCRVATHFVSSIAVGAYTTRSLSPAALVTANPRGESGELRGFVDREDTVGTPMTCAQGGAELPPQPGCTVPLALSLSPVSVGTTTEPFRVSDLADASMVPSVVNMPGGLPAPSPLGSAGRQGGDSCYRSFQPSGDATQDLAELGKSCAAAAGMLPKSKVLVGHQAPKEQPDTFVVQLDSGACYRAFAVGARGVRELNLAWRGPDGDIVAKDLRPGSWSVVGTDGPFCPAVSGLYELVVAVEAGSGAFAAQVWELGR